MSIILCVCRVGTGPPGSIQLPSRRIVVPAYHSSKPLPRLDGDFSEAHMMISDDEGTSWYIGGSIADWLFQFPSENQAVSLGGDTVFVNARTLLTDHIHIHTHITYTYMYNTSSDRN